MKKSKWIQEIGLLRRSVNSMAALAAVLLLGGCTYQLSGLLAASGYGGTISQEVIDSEPRPPKQVVFRFDEHRYIENDPSGGFVGGCQGEMYYVDEKLGIKTKFGGNKKNNPKGVFKVDSPYVVVRDADSVRVSFDQGRSFEAFIQVDDDEDIAVKGERIYDGGGGAEYKNPSDAFADRRGLALYLIDGEARKVVLLKKQPQDTLRSEAKSLGAIDYFACLDLPWRPSVKRERERAKALATQKGGVKP